MKIKGHILKNPNLFREQIRSRRCCDCNFDSLRLVYYKYTLNSDVVSISLAHPSAHDIKEFNGTRVKNITLDSPYNAPSEASSIKILKVHCTNCDWNEEVIARGVLDPNCVGYTPHAIDSIPYNVPRTRCLGFTLKGVGCKAAIEKDTYLCHKHNNSKNKKALKLWFKRRGLPIDLT